ncbi:MAG: beta-1,6-N-acetylglucosaminyltransferase [Bacteroidota bacterium]
MAFLIHVDKKSKIDDFSIQFDESRLMVDYLDKRYNVQWGDISIVDATFSLIKYANDNYIYKHVVLISGEDVVVNMSAIVSLGPDVSLMNHWLLPYDKWWGGGIFRIDRPHFFNNKHRRNLNFKLHRYFGELFNRHAPQAQMAKHFPEMVFYGGQQWMVLSKEAVNYLLQFVSDHPKIWDVFKYSFAPDELFIQTILCNNKSLKIINKPTHYVRFNGFDSSPEYLSADEVDALKKDGAYMFARKYAG